MTLVLLPLILSLAPALEPAVEAYPVYERWRRQDAEFIRVGLKRPEKRVQLFSPDALLVLDGERVAGTIQPGGEFWIVRKKGSKSAPRYFVQVLATKNVNYLRIKRNQIQARFPDLALVSAQVRGDLKALRLGPFERKDKAEEWRELMVAEGYDDAFLTRTASSWPYQWVNDDFDKFDLRANDLALARLDPDKPIYYQGNAYRGVLRFESAGSKIRVINDLPLEEYLLGVVPTELGPRAYPELEAQKAQAVAARTYALKNRGRFESRGYDICDGPACQAYEGMTNEDPLSTQAVRETAGIVLTYEGELIDALYTSTDGGATDDVGNVFPGRDEPYLRGKSSYLAEFRKWTLPQRSIDRKAFRAVGDDLAVRALLYGFSEIPDFSGPLQVEDFDAAMQALSWILGARPPVASSSPISRRQFWRAMAELDFFKAAAANQVRDQDAARMLAAHDVPAELGRFAALLLRYDLVDKPALDSMSDEAPMPRAEAYRLLIALCERLGPQPEWKKYRIEHISDRVVTARRGRQVDEIPLENVRHYVYEVGGKYMFREAPILEDLDRVSTLEPPFPDNLLRVNEAGRVASVDRFSAFDFWIEKKSVDELEKRARRYVRGLRGLRDVKILARSETGRVTLMEYIADSGRHKVDGLNIRWSLGVRDNLFDLLPAYKDGRLTHIAAMGRGWGHGVGMSQVGAYGLARMGWSYDRILTYFYTDVELQRYGQKPESQN